MEVTINQDQMDEIFSKTSNLLSEALLRFTEDGMRMTSADPAMVAMVDLEIPSDSFNDYNIDTESEEYEEFTQTGEEGMLVGVNIENLASIINLFDEEITISLDENEIVLTEILNLSTDDIPSMDALDNHSIGGDLSNDDFKTLTKKLAVASEATTLTAHDDGELGVEGGGDQISVETSFQLDNHEVFEDDDGDTEEEVSSMFSLDYLKKARQMFGKLDSCDEVNVRLGNDFPMTMTHESDRENLKFVLAPRIEEQ